MKIKLIVLYNADLVDLSFMGKQKRLDSFFKKKDDNLESSTPSKSPRLEHQSPSQSLIKSHVVGVEEVNILKRDSGLRRSMLKYSVNQRDEIRRSYLNKGPCQIQLSSYPYSS